jgi:hypothetical protein
MQKRIQQDLVAIRLPKDLKKAIPNGNLSGFIKEAIREKLDREEGLKTCPTCKGTGKVRK